MKLFHQLLVAPAALGLLAPVAANATELNINGVSDYAASGEQVTSITQFSDVYPTDWAYQALSNLIERYGCVAGYPNGTYRGNRAMTRFEAAALLNACLDRVTEVTDELKRLMKEFEKELAILKGRVDGLEARVGELEATQFSTTTKLKGQATFVIGANSFGGDAKVINSPYVNLENPQNLRSPEKRVNIAAAQSGATSFNYDLKLFLDTSFTGKDLLRTVLRAGNFQNSTFGDDKSFGGFGDGNSVYRRGGTGLDSLEVAFQEPDRPNNVAVNRLFYQFPVGESITATIGGLVRQDDMLEVWPSAYPADSVLQIFNYAGAPNTYNLSLGSGAGLSWESDGFSISASYLSGNGGFSQTSNSPDPNISGTLNCINSGGILNDCSATSGTLQVAYAPENWGVAAAYNYYSGNNNPNKTSGGSTPFAKALYNLGNNNSVGLSAWWSPQESGWIPSISTGWGLSQSFNFKDSYLLSPFLSPRQNAEGSRVEVNNFTSQSWYVGLQWSDAFLNGNTLGLAIGQPTFVTSVDFKSNDESNFVADGNYAMELWYAFQVTDNITVTPAIYYLSRPLGQLTNGAGSEGDRNDTYNNFGGLLKTTFKF
ncbi:outer membrane porin [Synechococcus sp. SYN20]|uniref:iron uptake porin n=1 Tax=Synechococcus sp. SYN20 TaxID=1050714 RepID=UPI0016488797|nr:iron uptake porin [Synechococcus sp. SYN20]QNJ25720.1 outer membrane porin [Synechococcus sp. SYN20]